MFDLSCPSAANIRYMPPNCPVSASQLDTNTHKHTIGDTQVDANY
jgi:hypothetical protein